MELIDGDELRRKLERLTSIGNTHAWNAAIRISLEALDAMPSVEQPVGMTRVDVLAALDAAEARGDKAVVEVFAPYYARWEGRDHRWVDEWKSPEVPRLNVRVRVTEQAPEQVPLTQLVGRTIHGEELPVSVPPFYSGEWCWQAREGGGRLRPFPDGTLDLATGLVAVRPVGEA
jgi:hypothetical protein